jgi:hypothetical protein
MKKFVLDITETGRENLKIPASSFNSFIKRFDTKEELKKYLIERYGKLPKGRRKIYYETHDKEATLKRTTIKCGFIHSFWNQDVSHNSHKWYQTDWICFWEEDTERIFFSLTPTTKKEKKYNWYAHHSRWGLFNNQTI